MGQTGDKGRLEEEEESTVNFNSMMKMVIMTIFIIELKLTVLVMVDDTINVHILKMTIKLIVSCKI